VEPEPLSWPPPRTVVEPCEGFRLGVRLRRAGLARASGLAGIYEAGGVDQREVEAQLRGFRGLLGHEGEEAQGPRELVELERLAAVGVERAPVLGVSTNRFLGFRQLWRGVAPDERTAGTPKLVRGRAYAWVRHPGYALVLASFFCANTMTLDRFVILAATLAYLLLYGIPLEERKLVALFGPEYEEYRRRVPALLPGC
jgi:hypothetical protein